MHYVYILKCADGKLYSGCTNDLKDRLHRHSTKQTKATADRLPIKLVSYIAFLEKHKAYAYEKYLKSGSGRAFLKRHVL